jgi:Uma2 family endonuclease
MTSNIGKPATLNPSPGRFRLPDIPEREPDEVTQFDHLFKTGRSHALAVHLGNPETTLVEADRWIIAEPGTFQDLARCPDLLVSFDADPAIYKANNGYIVSEQGKPPDFVLEVASASTANTDTGAKRDDYARLGIPEYWRFDETGQHHGTRLAGDRLESGAYVPMQIEELSEDVLQGYSPALNLYLRWERGVLSWYDPATERHIVTFDDLQERVDQERAARRQTEARLQAERVARMQAEERIRQLEAQLSQDR